MNDTETIGFLIFVSEEEDDANPLPLSEEDEDWLDDVELMLERDGEDDEDDEDDDDIEWFGAIVIWLEHDAMKAQEIMATAIALIFLEMIFAFCLFSIKYNYAPDGIEKEIDQERK